MFPSFRRLYIEAGWNKKYDNDLHIYPYTQAEAAALSFGCSHQCAFCPTGNYFKGHVFRCKDIVQTLDPYQFRTVHFMDEDFFDNPRLHEILNILRHFSITWSCMATEESFLRILQVFGERRLFESGLRLVEIGLENATFAMKVKHCLYHLEQIVVYYLNMTFLPGETKESIRQTGFWMQGKDLQNKRPIHFNNGLSYAPGQFYYPYRDRTEDGIMVKIGNPPLARTRPSYVPFTFLEEHVSIIDVERVNYYSQLVYGLKMYPLTKGGNVKYYLEIYGPEILMWLVIGLRIGAIV